MAALEEPRADGLAASEPGYAALLRALLTSWSGLAATCARLFALELQRAGVGLAVMVGLAFAITLLLSATWFIGLALAFAGLVSAGLDWPLAGFVLLGLNIVGAALLAAGLRSASACLRFDGTRDALSCFREQRNR